MHRTILQKYHPHRTAPYDVEKMNTAPHRTVRFSKNKNHTEPHGVIAKIEKPHRGAVLHREKPWYW